MYKYLIIIAGFIIFLGCKSNPPGNPQGNISHLKYTGDGRLFEIDSTLTSLNFTGSIIVDDGVLSGNVVYVLRGNHTVNNNIFDPNNFGIRIPLTTNASQLVSGFSTNQAVAGNSITGYLGAYVGDVNYDDYTGANDLFTVNISSVVNGYASGTFTATINDSNNNRTFTVVAGQFTNVQILY